LGGRPGDRDGCEHGVWIARRRCVGDHRRRRRTRGDVEDDRHGGAHASDEHGVAKLGAAGWPVHPTLARMLAAWKLSHGERVDGRAPGLMT
jgi:hypothetical protein